MRKRWARTILVSCATACAALASGGIRAQGDALDCVIEPRSTIELGSPEEGILAEVLVRRGDRVGKGTPVARLDAELEKLAVELTRLRAEADADTLSGRAQVEFRRKEVGRIQALQSKQHAPEKDYEQALIERRLADFSLQAAEMEHRIAQVEHERAKARLARRTISSPVDGVIVDVTMSSGEYVHKQATVMVIAEVDPLNVEVFVPVARYGSVSPGKLAEVKPEAPVGGTYPARVIVVDSVFDAASRTFGVRLELPNPNHVLPAGVRCTVNFQ